METPTSGGVRANLASPQRLSNAPNEPTQKEPGQPSKAYWARTVPWALIVLIGLEWLPLPGHEIPVKALAGMSCSSAASPTMLKSAMLLRRGGTRKSQELWKEIMKKGMVRAPFEISIHLSIYLHVSSELSFLANSTFTHSCWKGVGSQGSSDRLGAELQV